MSWQPIETAPKNVDVLVYPSNTLGRSCDMAIFTEAHGYWMESLPFRTEKLHPTHWMPLPETPQSSQGATNE